MLSFAYFLFVFCKEIIWVNFSSPPPPILPAVASFLLLPPSSCVFSCSLLVTPGPCELLKIQEGGLHFVITDSMLGVKGRT